jgi:hypothetical protein
MCDCSDSIANGAIPVVSSGGFTQPLANLVVSNTVTTTNLVTTTMNVSSISIPNFQAISGYTLVTNGSTVYWAPNYNLIFTGTNSTRTLTGYVENNVFYAVTGSAITGGQLVISIQSFNPSFTFTTTPSSLNWNVPITAFSVTVNNIPGLTVEYLSQVYSINTATVGYVDQNFGNYTITSTDGTATQTKPNVHSIQTPWTDTFTETGCIRSNGTGTTGGTAKFEVSFNTFISGNYSVWPTNLTINAPTWASISAQNQFTNIPSTLTFLQNFQTASFTVTYSGYTGSPTIDNSIGNGGIGTISGSTIVIGTPYMYKNNPVTLNLYSNVTFTRPATVTGTGYTQNVAYSSLTTPSPTYTYPYFWTQDVAQHVITSSTEVVTGTSWAANDSALVNSSSSLQTSATVTNREFYIGFSRQNGYSNVIVRDSGNNLIPPDYAGTLSILPRGSDVPGGYTAVPYVYYRFYIPSNQTITLYTSTTAPFDGTSSVTITPVSLSTFLSNVSNTPFTSSYTGSFPATLALALDATTTTGTTYSNALVGSINSGTITFKNSTLHKNSNYTIKMNLSGNFYTGDTIQTQPITQSATLAAPTVSWPVFWAQKTKNPTNFISADVLNGTWTSGSSLVNTFPGFPQGSFSFNNSTSPEFFIGYSSNNSTFSTATTFIQVSAGGKVLTPAPYVVNDQSQIDGTVNLLPVGSPSDYLSEKFKYFRFYIPGSSPQLSISTFTSSGYDGSSYAYVNPVVLTTFLSNVSSTGYGVSYTGHYGGTMAITKNFQGSTSSEVYTGNAFTGTHTFPNMTMHKNSSYVSNISLITTFIRPGIDTQVSPVAVGGSNVFTPSVSLYPTFYTTKSLEYQPLISTDVVTNTWLTNPSLQNASTVQGLPSGTISSGTSGSSPEFFFGYSRKSQIGYSNLAVAISGVYQTPDYSGVVNLSPSGAPGDFTSEPYVYYRYYLPVGSSLSFSSNNSPITTSASPVLTIAPVSLLNILRYNNSTTFTINYSGNFYATVSISSYPSNLGSLTGIGKLGNTTSGTLNWPQVLYNQNNFSLGFSVTATYQTPEGITYTPAATTNTGVFRASVANYPTFWTEKSQGYTLTNSDVVTGTYAGNNGDFVNSNTSPITSNTITPSTTNREIYFGYSRSLTTQDIIANQNGGSLTPDYASTIALSPIGAPGSWIPTSYVYWRYLVNSTAGITFTLITQGASPTGTPTLSITQPVTSNNFLNWVSSTTYTASYSGYYYGIMSLTNNGQGTLSGSLIGNVNSGTLDFGFKLHNSNSFNLSISMSTQFQSPDVFAPSPIVVNPTGWTNNSVATLSAQYPTFWIVKDNLSTSPASSDIVTGTYAANSGNFVATNVSGSLTASGFTNGLFINGSATDHQVSFTVNSYTVDTRMFYYCWSIKNINYNSSLSPHIWLRTTGGTTWGEVNFSGSGTVTIQTSDAPAGGGGSTTYNYVRFFLGGSSTGTDVQVYWA